MSEKKVCPDCGDTTLFLEVTGTALTPECSECGGPVKALEIRNVHFDGCSKAAPPEGPQPEMRPDPTDAAGWRVRAFHSLTELGDEDRTAVWNALAEVSDRPGAPEPVAWPDLVERIENVLNDYGQRGLRLPKDMQQGFLAALVAASTPPASALPGERDPLQPIAGSPNTYAQCSYCRWKIPGCHCGAFPARPEAPEAREEVVGDGRCLQETADPNKPTPSEELDKVGAGGSVGQTELVVPPPVPPAPTQEPVAWRYRIEDAIYDSADGLTHGQWAFLERKPSVKGLRENYSVQPLYLGAPAPEVTEEMVERAADVLARMRALRALLEERKP